MGNKWEIFDNMREAVFVTDNSSYELVYMNKYAMQISGIRSRDDYQGKKCHSIIQGCSSPCSICKASELTVGQYVEWQYYNPGLDRYFLIKDTLIEEDDRQFHMEIAIDITAQEKRSDLLRNYQDLEIIVNNGIRLALNEPVPDKSLDIILEFIGMALKGERTYIFERDQNGCDDNTYEWVAAGITPEKDNLQNLPPEVCANWYRNFSESKNILIEDIEDIRETDPLQYENLKRQNIRSIAVVPLYLDGKVLGFYGIDNPPQHTLEYATNMLQIMGHFIVSTLKRRNLVKELQDMSFSDQLTGLGNRHAMEDFIEKMNRSRRTGVVFCDITGLKKLNDSEGHSAGDRLICGCADALRCAFDEYGLFRIGGDEMLVICCGITEQQLAERVDRLHRELADRDMTMAVGSFWQESADDLNEMIKEAERLMYTEKSEYYRIMGLDRRRF